MPMELNWFTQTSVQALSQRAPLLHRHLRESSWQKLTCISHSSGDGAPTQLRPQLWSEVDKRKIDKSLINSLPRSAWRVIWMPSHHRHQLTSSTSNPFSVSFSSLSCGSKLLSFLVLLARVKVIYLLGARSERPLSPLNVPINTGPVSE